MEPLHRVLPCLAAVMLALCATAAGDCSGPIKPKDMTTCKVMIVGGGPGGLFSAYVLRHLGSDLCIADRSSTFGVTTRPLTGSSGAGNVQDFVGPVTDANGEPAAFGTCGLRINEAQMGLRCLSNQLNVTLEESNFDNIITARGHTVRSMQQFITDGVFKLNSSFTDDLETAIYEWALVNKTDINPLTGEAGPRPALQCGKYARVMEYMRDVVGPEAADFMMAGNSFRGDWKQTLDVCQYIEFFKADWARCCTNFYPRGGFSSIFLKLSAAIKATGVRTYKSTNIKCLREQKTEDGETRYIATMENGKGWIAERMIVNAGPSDLQKMGGALAKNLAKDPQIQAIKPVGVVLYNAFFPSNFWKGYQEISGHNFRTVTDRTCSVRAEYPSHPYVTNTNVSRPVYVDDPDCIPSFNALYEQGGVKAVRQQALTDVQFVFPGETIPAPTWEIYRYNPKGWHYMQPFSTQRGITISSIKEWALHPLGKKNLCMVGEPYNLDNSAWNDGPWQSMLGCMSENFMDLMTDEARDKFEFLKSACNGATTFSNEVFPDHVSIDHPGGLKGPPAKRNRAQRFRL